MTKRLKVSRPDDGASTVRATRLCDDIVIEQRPWGLRVKSAMSYIDFSPVQWVEAVAAVEVEDVPTPGARVRAAWMAEGHPMPSDQSGSWDRIAARLGLTEGE